MKVALLTTALALATAVFAQNQQPSNAHEHPQAASADHYAGVDTRGGHAMGFSQDTTTHHFDLLPDGGSIRVTANDANDLSTRDQIRAHLAHIAQMFTAGNFQIPMFIHDTIPPGVTVMKSRQSSITYTFEPTPDGGVVHIRTTDAEALRAIHQFLQFQIADHRTADSKAVHPPA